MRSSDRRHAKKRAEPQDARRDGLEAPASVGPRRRARAWAKIRKKASEQAEAAARAHRKREVAFQEGPASADFLGEGIAAEGIVRAQAPGHEGGDGRAYAHWAGRGRYGWRSPRRRPWPDAPPPRPAKRATFFHVERDRGFRRGHQTGRPVTRSRASDRRRFLARRHLARAAVGERMQVEGVEGRGVMSWAAKAPAQKRRFSATVSLRLEPVGMAPHRRWRPGAQSMAPGKRPGSAPASVAQQCRLARGRSGRAGSGRPPRATENPTPARTCAEPRAQERVGHGQKHGPSAGQPIARGRGSASGRPGARVKGFARRLAANSDKV